MPNKVYFKFEELDYQEDAINSVVGLLDGIDRQTTNAVYGVVSYIRGFLNENQRPEANATFTVGNRLIENMRNIQYKNGLFKDNQLASNIPQFTIEMETGTGKTFVYLKTILSLWQTYGGQFKKFIIVVPSNPILLGVKKSIEMLSDYFKPKFNNLSLDSCCLVYRGSSEKGSLEKVSSEFIENTGLSILLITNSSFNKESNLLRKAKEDGVIVWEDIKAIKPIVIIDEPQKMEGSGSSKTSKTKKTNTKSGKSSSMQAIEELEPLMILRYSATHKNLYNQIYKLNSFQAYKQHLVKGIKVTTIHSLTKKDFPYIRYIGMTADLRGRIEIFANQGSRVKLCKFNVDINSSLDELSSGLPQYKGYYIAEQPRKNAPLIIACGNGSFLNLDKGKSNDETSPEESVEKLMEIAIKAHIDKQIELLKAGKKIKALTLFFVDSVAKVRSSEDDGRGEYLRIFDKVFDRIRRMPKYYENFNRLRKELAYLDPESPVTDVREGYFAIDKKKNFVEIDKWDSSLNDEDVSFNAKTQEDIDRGIDLILNKKDELISFDSKLNFIFSHSALREGWDNPNVFTLVTLKERSNEIAKKQEIGRGLRLPVDIYGNRCYDDNLNELTVVANSYYDEFAEALQKDFNEQNGFDANEVTANTIKVVLERTGIPANKIEEASEAFKNELISKGIVSVKNNSLIIPKNQENLDNIQFDNPILQEHSIKLKEAFADTLVEQGSTRIEVKNGDDEPEPNSQQKYVSEDDFSKMYNTVLRILQKRSIYRYEIDKNAFIKDVTNKLNEFLLEKSKKTEFFVQRGKVEIKETGTINVVKKSNDKLYGNEIIYNERSDFELALIIMNKSILPRQCIFSILDGLSKTARNRINNQDYLNEAIKIIEDKLIEYRGKSFLEAELIPGETADEADIFAIDNINIDDALGDNPLVFVPEPSHRKAVNVKYKFDSKGELEFAKQLDNDANVLLYTKLKKGGFVIETPAGNYSPDWAIVYRNENDSVSMYFIAETKWDKSWKDLQETEKIKIRCAEKHFEAVDKAFPEKIKYAWVNSYKEQYKGASFPEVFVNEQLGVRNEQFDEMMETGLKQAKQDEAYDVNEAFEHLEKGSL